MPGNSFGHAFRITTAGESHGPANVVIVDGVPAGLALSEDDLQPDLDRRRPGQSRLVTQRKESDVARILSGVHEGRTTGTSIAILVANEDARSKDYSDIENLYRPGHADHGFDARYGRRDHRGGGRSSARETVVRVAAGAIAKKLLEVQFGVRVLGWVASVGEVAMPDIDPTTLTLDDVEASPTRCPHPETAARMEALIDATRKDRDSIGGTAEIVAIGVPAGWGEPVFDKVKADLGKALFSLPAVMGVSYGSGFAAARMKGSEHNDPFVTSGDGTITTDGNDHGGMLGGITSGQPIRLTCAVKPTSSIPRVQPTVDRDGQPAEIQVRGRHDPCLLPRFVPMAEAMVAITLADHALRTRGARLEP